MFKVNNEGVLFVDFEHVINCWLGKITFAYVLLLSQFSTVINIQPTCQCSVKVIKPFVLSIFSSELIDGKIYTENDVK